MTNKLKSIAIGLLISIMLAIPSIAEDLSTYREIINSDDTKSIDEALEKKENSFTVKEYRIYRAIINTPMSTTEVQAIQNVANQYGVTPVEAKKATLKIQKILSKNNWFGSSETEIKYAYDWNGEKQ